MSQVILKNTLKSASYNVVFQVFVKGITFILNALALRFITKDVIGVINVRLLLLESTILFISREAFRRVALSQAQLRSWPQIINLVWLTPWGLLKLSGLYENFVFHKRTMEMKPPRVPLSVVTSFVFSYVWINLLETPPIDVTPHYKIGVWSVSIGCVIEIFTEPLNIISQVYSFITLKIVLSTLVILIRALIFMPWIIASPKSAIIAFSFGYLVSNFFLFGIFYSYFYYYIKNNNHRGGISRKDQTQVFPFRSVKEFFPRGLKSKEWIHPTSAYLTWSFFKQGILKQILTEGEHYIMTLFPIMTFHEQGLYDIVNNLGSLVVRFIFRPVEESLYFYFSQCLKRDKSIMDQNKDVMKEASTVLHRSLSIFIDIGILIFIFGQNYSEFLLYIYGGKELASGQGPILLRTHCFSVLLLGINGITECYVFSTMSADQLNRHNYTMAGFSIFFLVISWGLTQLFGGIGFILANCCNMAARIFNSLLFIKNKYYNTTYQPLQGLLPPKFYSASLLGVLIITKATENYGSSIQHFLTGIICLIIVTGIWCFEKKDLVLLIIDKWELRSKKGLKKNSANKHSIKQD